MGLKLANVPDNWVFSTSHFSKGDVERIFSAIAADKEEVGPFTFLVKPHPGHERAVRYICGHLFKRMRGSKARTLLAERKAATS